MSYNAENPYPDKQRKNYHSLDYEDDNYFEHMIIDNNEDLTVSFHSNNILLKCIDKNILMGEDVTSFMLKPNEFFIKSFNNELFVYHIINKMKKYDLKKYGFNYSISEIDYYISDYLESDIEILLLIDYLIENKKINKILKEIANKYIDIYQNTNLVEDIDNMEDITIDLLFQELKKYSNAYDETKELINLVSLINNESFLLSELTENIKDMIFNKYSKYFKLDFEDIKSRKFSDLSHGEKSIYGLMVNLKYKISNLEKSKFLFCLDEPDISLHPEWQRKFILELFTYINNKNVEIHFILTTHSPFILSDIPKKNILFLDTNKHNKIEIKKGLNELKETFAANIHTLLSDGFFMDNGLMGEFAKNKISKILNFLNGKNTFIDTPINQIKPTIELIGEDFLREKLLKMYDEKFPISKEEKIKHLEEELKRLKNAQNRI
jgi:predicted ATP-dependent endonuclease of OLD family